MNDDPVPISLKPETIARLAHVILSRCEDGAKLVTIHKHYPTGIDAAKLGFCLAVGAICGFGVSLGTGALIQRVIEALA